MKNGLNILVIDEDIANISYFTMIALGLVPDVNIHVLATGMRRLDPLRYSRYISSYRTIDRDADDIFIETIRQHADATNSTVLMPVTERTMKFFSKRKDELQVFGNIPAVAPIDTLNQVTSKWELHQWLETNGYPAAKCISGDVGVDELLHSIDSLRFPVLIKPIHGSAGTGIKKFESPGEVKDYLTKTGAKDLNRFIFQEYIQGSDIDISALCLEGAILNHTIQRGLCSNTLRFSTAIEFIEDEALLKLSSEIFRKLNFSGIAHLDFRLSNESGRYYLVDFNARFWSSILGSLEAGINFPGQYLKTALNEHISPIRYQKISYQFSSEAIKSFFAFRKRRIMIKNGSVRTQLRYNLTDPVPAIMSFIKKLSRQ